jgi:hypothetical protein
LIAVADWQIPYSLLTDVEEVSRELALLSKLADVNAFKANSLKRVVSQNQVGHFPLISIITYVHRAVCKEMHAMARQVSRVAKG